jgi:hypothetical protein
MRFSLRTVLTALAAILALTAITASAATAAPEWYVKKAKTWSKVSTPVNVTFKGSYELTFEFNGSYDKFKCEENKIEGTIGSGGLGTISTFEQLEPHRLCKGIETEKKLNECPSIEKVNAFNLPWQTDLYAEGGATRAKIVHKEGALGAASEWTCNTEFFGKHPLVCSVETSTQLTNNGIAGTVESNSDSKSNKVWCVKESQVGGAWTFREIIRPTEAEKTAGVEAIKVE